MDYHGFAQVHTIHHENATDSRPKKHGKVWDLMLLPHILAKGTKTYIMPHNNG